MSATALNIFIQYLQGFMLNKIRQSFLLVTIEP